MSVRRSRQQKNKRGFKQPRFFASKWFFLITGAFFFIFTVSLVKEFYRSYQINHEIALLQQEINSLESSNGELSEFVEFLKTDRYFEEEARLKYGLKKPGEQVIVVQNNDNDDSVNIKETTSVKRSGSKTNFQKWLELILG